MIAEPSANAFRNVEEELARCLRLLLALFPDREFREMPPDLVVERGFGPLAEQPVRNRRSHTVTVYARRDLNRPTEEVLTILLHKAVHAANAFRWHRDCSASGYHNQQFRRLAERVGFEVTRINTRFGWAGTTPTPKIRRFFRDLALTKEVLDPFRDPSISWSRRLIWHCGLLSFPDRQKLESLHLTAMGRQHTGSRPVRQVRSATVHKIWRDREYVPMLRLTGRWLRSFGFHESCPMKVEAELGQLTIQAHYLAPDKRAQPPR